MVSFKEVELLSECFFKLIMLPCFTIGYLLHTLNRWVRTFDMKRLHLKGSFVDYILDCLSLK